MFICFFSDAFANHISGGEMIYRYMGPEALNSKQYRITLSDVQNAGGVCGNANQCFVPHL
ncbi:MAG: hypothetical protein IPP96_08860 [Chitinophagaceae bacterium]|nr:hypothetical protein [Chitinophagaceae bacterium]